MAQWLSGRALDSRPRGCRFEPHRHHFVVSLSKNINPSLVLVQPRKTCPFITERVLMGHKDSNQTNKIAEAGPTKQAVHLSCYFRASELFIRTLWSVCKSGFPSSIC